MKVTSGWLWTAATVVFLASAAPAATQVGPQATWTTLADQECRGNGRNDDRLCEVREATLAAGGRLTVDGGANGGVRVTGWERNEVRVRARVWAGARSEEWAAELLRGVELETSGGTLRARGPDRERRESWGVSWDVMVPLESDLSLETNNGGISVEGVSGLIDFDAANGGVSLVDVGGDVRGRTRNGGLEVMLAGSTWAGRGLDAETTNGGVEIAIPEGYSAELETGTVNGRVDLDFPVMVQGRIGRSLFTVLGDGGPVIRATTTNGSVRLVRR